MPRRCGEPGHTGWARRWLLAAVVALLVGGLGVAAPQGSASARSAAGVLPPSANPHGYSRADMTRLLALFTTSGNQAQYYPDTPFQILYVDPALVDARFQTRHGVPCGTPGPDCGLHVTQVGRYANTFQVPAGTSFFVPVDNADDSPPVVGVFPTSEKAARAYIFDPRQVGGRGFAICIDGRTTALGPAYVAGPEETPPLLDGGGTHMITIGAFLSPMARGSHDVRITGGYFGAGILDTYGFGFISLDFTYRVQVGR